MSGHEHNFLNDFSACLGCGKYAEQLIDARYCDLSKQLAFANGRNVGQFHLFVNGVYQRISNNNFTLAVASAERNGGVILNQDGNQLWPEP